MPAIRPGLALPAAALLAGAAFVAGATTSSAATTDFQALCDRAMDTMMQAMARPAAGDVDADFARMMIPHHQGAIDMAVAELRYGHNERLRRIAQEIVVDQQQEIGAMRLALDEPTHGNTP